MTALLERLPPEWLVEPFGALIADSAFGPRFGGECYAPDGNVATLRTTDMDDDGRINYKTMPRARLDEDRFANHILHKGDLVITRSGTCGIAGVFRGFERPVLPGAFLIRCRMNDRAEVHYYRHLFNSPGGRDHLLSIAAGAVQQNINLTNLKALHVPVPPLATQQRIASILSAYDDLIENNTRRIAILEEMARRIYEEWFVRFRFPGHEGVKMVESELGLVPEGWRTDVLAGVCEPKTGIQTGPFGSQLHKADYSEVGVPVLMPKDLIGFRIEEDSVARVPEATAESLKRHRMRPGDIAYGRRGDIGRRAFIMAHQAGWLCGTGCLRIRPDSKKINGWYVFNYLGQDSVVGLIAGRAHGVTMPNLNAQLLESVPVVCPPRELQDQFERISFPIAELRENLIAKNANLRTTRDLLLPKLISGELGVSAMPEPEARAA